MDSTQKMARRVLRLETTVKRLATQPRLPFSSIDGGTLDWTDDDGTTTVTVGEQYDGTNGPVVLTGPPPPPPTVPLVTESVAGLKVYWDGTFYGGAVAPLDFSRVTIHAHPLATFEDYDPLDQRYIVGTLPSATGGEMLIALPYEEHIVYLVAWSTAGKFSEASIPDFGTPSRITIPDIEAELRAEIEAGAAAAADAAEALDAANAAGQSASTAQQAAEAAADDAAEAAGLVADKAVIRIQGTAPAVTDQNANTLWIDTADGNKPKRWDGDSWEPVQDQAATQAAADAAQAAADAASALEAAQQAAQDANAAGGLATSAMDAANGKNTVVRATYPPSDEPNVEGDIWWYRDGITGKILGFYLGTGGTTWVQEEISNEIIGELDAGKVTFGTMSGERIEVGSIVIGQVRDLDDTLASKETPEGAAITANQAASAAQTAAIDAAAQAAADEYGETKTLVAGWTVTGKTTINGGKIETDSILAAQIKAGEIKAVHLEADSVTADAIKAGEVHAEHLEAGLLEAGFVLTGKIQVGTATWDTTDGLVIPQPDGGRIVFPVNGDPAQISAHLDAFSLTVRDRLKIRGALNEVEAGAIISLSNGVSAPTQIPSVIASWPSQPFNFAPGFDDGLRGLVRYDSNSWYAASVFFGSSDIRVCDNNGTGFGVVVNLPATFYPTGGLTIIGTTAYVLGYDTNRPDNDGNQPYRWFVRRYDVANWAYLGEWEFDQADNSSYNPVIGKTSGGNVLIARCPTGGKPNIYEFTPSGGFVKTVIGELVIGGHLTSVYYGVADHSGGAARYVVSSDAGIYAFDAAGTRLPAAEWTRANNAKVRGLTWDTIDARWYSLDDKGMRHTYGTLNADILRSFAYSWFDSDPGGTGQHETSRSPARYYVHKSRTYLTVTTPPPNDTGGSDDPDSVRIWIDGWRQPDVGVGVTKETYNIPVTGTSSKGPDFPTTNLAATIRSGKASSDAQGYMIELRGDGSGRTGPYRWDSNGRPLGHGEYTSTHAAALTSGVRSTRSVWTLRDGIPSSEITYAGSGLFTVARSGLYVIMGTVAVTVSGAPTGRRTVVIARTRAGVESDIYVADYAGSTNSSTALPFNMTTYLEANDAISIQVLVGQAGLNHEGGPTRNVLSIHQLAAW